MTKESVQALKDKYEPALERGELTQQEYDEVIKDCLFIIKMIE